MSDPVTITYLEMHALAAEPPRPLPDDAAVVRADPPTVGFYRFLYDAVGAPWAWTDRKALGDAALAAIVRDPAVEVHVLYRRGTPLGYAELDARAAPDVQLAYFGLVPEAIGQGLGRPFLDWAVRAAWRRAGDGGRVWVHTCTLDHPRALPLYEQAGFKRYRQEVVRTGPPGT